MIYIEKKHKFVLIINTDKNITFCEQEMNNLNL